MAHSETEENEPIGINQEFRLVAGREILFDREGFLYSPEDWSEDVAEALAREKGLETLTEIHWRVIRFLRQFYMDYGRAPLNRDIRAATNLSLLELESLFPGGILGGARLLAGLPNPKTCAG